LRYVYEIGAYVLVLFSSGHGLGAPPSSHLEGHYINSLHRQIDR